MFEPYVWQDRNIGFAKTQGNIFAFFGNRNIVAAQLPEAFPQFKFLKLKQVHGVDVIPATNKLEVADAHFSHNINEALIIETADCMPVLMANATTIAACHAGWRGVAGKIIPATMKAMGKVDAIFIGPHIGPKSFEVGVEVAEQLLAAAGSRNPRDRLVMSHKDPNKRMIHLARLAMSQIIAAANPPPPTEILHFDTKTNLAFHSFRRDGVNAERQYSFIVRLR